jgi:DNA (cytosine-5)-methyltransferase 1
MKNKKSTTNDYSIVDVFCGVGGLSHGFVKEGFKVLAGFDLDASCKYAYEKNNSAKFIQKSIEVLTGEEVNALYGENEIRILVGCAPCAPFSKYTQGRPNEKWKLLRQFRRVILESQPDVISMENVPELEKHVAFTRFVSALKRAGYHVSYSVVFCPEYGIPQSRRRLVLLASKFGELTLLGKTHSKSRYRTVRSAIGRMPALEAGQSHAADRIHSCRSLEPINLERIKATPPGGGWADWREDLRLECHKKKSGKTYRSIYGRMNWDDLAPTLTTHCTGIGNGRFGHPQQDRAISLREAALLQTFPRYYRFVEPRKPVLNKTVSRQVGNAVPVRLGRIIARSIRRHLQDPTRGAR